MFVFQLREIIRDFFSVFFCFFLFLFLLRVRRRACASQLGGVQVIDLEEGAPWYLQGPETVIFSGEVYIRG